MTSTEQIVLRPSFSSDSKAPGPKMKVSEAAVTTFQVQEPRVGSVEEIIPNRVKDDANNPLPKLEKHFICAREFLDSVLGEVALRIERISMQPNSSPIMKPMAFQLNNEVKEERLKQKNIWSLNSTQKRVSFSSPVIANVFEDSEDMASQDTVILNHDSEDDSISKDPNENIIDFEMTSFCKKPNANIDKLEFSPYFNKVSKNCLNELIEKFQDGNAQPKSSCYSAETISVKHKKDNTSLVSFLDPKCNAKEKIDPIPNFSSRFQSLQQGFNALFVKKNQCENQQEKNNVFAEQPERTQISLPQQSAMTLKCLPNLESSSAPFDLSTKQEEPHTLLRHWLEKQKKLSKLEGNASRNNVSLAENIEKPTKQLQNFAGIQSKLPDAMENSLQPCMEHSPALTESKIKEENCEKFENENSESERRKENCSDSTKHESNNLHCPVSKELTLLISNEPDNKDADEWYMRTMKRKFDMKHDDIAVPIKCWCENENGNNDDYDEHETCSQHRQEYLLSEDQLVPSPDETNQAYLKCLQSELPANLSLEHNLVNNSEISNNHIEKINFSPVSEIGSQESIYAQSFRSQDSMLSQESIISLNVDKVVKDDDCKEHFPNADDFTVPLSGVNGTDMNYVVAQKSVDDQNENQRQLCAHEGKCALRSNMNVEIPSADHRNETTINNINSEASDSQTDIRNQVPSGASSISDSEDKYNEDTATLQVAPEAQPVIENEDIDRSALDATVPTTLCERKRIPGSVEVNSEVEVGGKCDNKEVTSSLQCSGGAVDTYKSTNPIVSSFVPDFTSRKPDICKRIESWFIDDYSPQSLAHSISYTPEDEYIDSSEGFEIHSTNLSGLFGFSKEKQWIGSTDEDESNVYGGYRKGDVQSKVVREESCDASQRNKKICLGESLEGDRTKRTEEDTSKFATGIESNEYVKKRIVDVDESCSSHVHVDGPSVKKLCLESVADPIDTFPIETKEIKDTNTVIETKAVADKQRLHIAEQLNLVNGQKQDGETEVQQCVANQDMRILDGKADNQMKASKACPSFVSQDLQGGGITGNWDRAQALNRRIENQRKQEVANKQIKLTALEASVPEKHNKSHILKKMQDKVKEESQALDSHAEDEQIVETKVNLSADENDAGFYQSASSANKRLDKTPEQMKVSIPKINQSPTKKLKSKDLNSPPPSCNRNSGAFKWSARRKLFSDKTEEEVFQDDDISNSGKNNDQRVVPCLTPSLTTRSSNRSDSTTSGANHSRGLRLGLSRRRTPNRLHPYWSAERIRSDRQIVPDLGMMQHENEE